jgi:hypothetical protein
VNRRQVLATLAGACTGATCGHGQDAKRSHADPVSRVATQASAADLRRLADDTEAKRARRAAAVFALFANHLKGPSGAYEAGKVFGEACWLTDAGLRKVGLHAGWLPVEADGRRTAFCLRVFPVEEEQTGWTICFVLSGDRSEAEARKFLRGDGGSGRKPDLLEFALCYPADPGKEIGRGRVEHFGPKGFRVLRPGD